MAHHAPPTCLLCPSAPCFPRFLHRPAPSCLGLALRRRHGGAGVGIDVAARGVSVDARHGGGAPECHVARLRHDVMGMSHRAAWRGSMPSQSALRLEVEEIRKVVDSWVPHVRCTVSMPHQRTYKVH